jgi:DNA-binding LacI/PurR family transcriptional regulator
MNALPQRQFLTDQAAALLREALARGQWGSTLPSEVELCRELQISRVTLRRSLRQLAQEGRIKFGGRGKHHRVLDAKIRLPSHQGHTIRLLSPYPRHQINASSQLVQNALHERLSKEGFSMHVEVHPGVYQRLAERDMARLLTLPDTGGWLLYLSTREVQEWFAKAGRPCVVLGRVHEGVELANVEFDFRSSCFHAAGLLLARGHTELCFLAPHPMTAGDKASAEGFCEGAAKGRPGGRATIVNYDTTVPDLCRALTGQMARRPPPTGILVAWPEHTFTVLGWLQRQGWRVPEDVAVISRSDDQYLNYSIPSVARYSVDSERMGRKAAELLLGQMRHGAGKIQSVRLMPEFIRGETLG